MSINWKTVGRRLGYGSSLLAVGGTAAYTSFGHIAAVARLGHQPPGLAALLPLSVDGMMAVATLAIAEDKAQGRKPRPWARVALALGALVSLSANIASTAVHHPDGLSIAVAAWSPIALFMVVEIMAKRGKEIPTATSTPVHATATVGTPAQTVATVNAPLAPKPRPMPVVVPATARPLPIAPARPARGHRRRATGTPPAGRSSGQAARHGLGQRAGHGRQPPHRPAVEQADTAAPPDGPLRRAGDVSSAPGHTGHPTRSPGLPRGGRGLFRLLAGKRFPSLAPRCPRSAGSCAPSRASRSTCGRGRPPGRRGS